MNRETQTEIAHDQNSTMLLSYFLFYNLLPFFHSPSTHVSITSCKKKCSDFVQIKKKEWKHTVSIPQIKEIYEKTYKEKNIFSHEYGNSAIAHIITLEKLQRKEGVSHSLKT